MSGLVAAWFGDAFAALHPQLRALHERGGTLRGDVEVAPRRARQRAQPQVGVDRGRMADDRQHGVVGEAVGVGPAVGQVEAVLAPTDDDERQRAIDRGYDLDRVLTTTDLVSGENVFFSATGVTDGDLLNGVRYFAGGCTTQSIVMRSKSGTVRMIEAYHRLSKLNEYSAVDFTGDTTAAYPLP